MVPVLDVVLGTFSIHNLKPVCGLAKGWEGMIQLFQLSDSVNISSPSFLSAFFTLITLLQIPMPGPPPLNMPTGLQPPAPAPGPLMGPYGPMVPPGAQQQQQQQGQGQPMGAGGAVGPYGAPQAPSVSPYGQPPGQPGGVPQDPQQQQPSLQSYGGPPAQLQQLATGGMNGQPLQFQPQQQLQPVLQQQQQQLRGPQPGTANWLLSQSQTPEGFNPTLDQQRVQQQAQIQAQMQQAQMQQQQYQAAQMQQQQQVLQPQMGGQFASGGGGYPQQLQHQPGMQQQYGGQQAMGPPMLQYNDQPQQYSQSHLAPTNQQGYVMQSPPQLMPFQQQSNAMMGGGITFQQQQQQFNMPQSQAPPQMAAGGYGGSYGLQQSQAGGLVPLR